LQYADPAAPGGSRPAASEKNRKTGRNLVGRVSDPQLLRPYRLPRARDPFDHPQRVQTAAGADRKRRPGPHPPAAARPAVGQRRQLHRRPHPDRHRQPPPGEDRGRRPFLHPDGAGDGLHLDGRETMKQKSLTIASRVLLLLTAALFLALLTLLCRGVPWPGVRWGALALGGALGLAPLSWPGLQ